METFFEKSEHTQTATCFRLHIRIKFTLKISISNFKTKNTELPTASQQC